MSAKSQAVSDQSALVERVATALYRWQWDSSDSLEALDIGEATDYRAMATVAIAAMELTGASDEQGAP